MSCHSLAQPLAQKVPVRLLLFPCPTSALNYFQAYLRQQSTRHTWNGFAGGALTNNVQIVSQEFKKHYALTRCAELHLQSNFSSAAKPRTSDESHVAPNPRFTVTSIADINVDSVFTGLCHLHCLCKASVGGWAVERPWALETLECPMPALRLLARRRLAA